LETRNRAPERARLILLFDAAYPDTETDVGSI